MLHSIEKKRRRKFAFDTYLHLTQHIHKRIRSSNIYHSVIYFALFCYHSVCMTMMMMMMCYANAGVNFYRLFFSSKKKKLCKNLMEWEKYHERTGRQKEINTRQWNKMRNRKMKLLIWFFPWAACKGIHFFLFLLLFRFIIFTTNLLSLCIFFSASAVHFCNFILLPQYFRYYSLDSNFC